MAEEGNRLVVERGPRKRKSSNKKGSKARKKLKVPPGSREKGKINPKMRKLFQKRAREYNSDDDDDEEELAPETRGDSALSAKNLEVEGGDSSEAEGNADSENEDFSDDEENGEIQPGTANFTEGLRAFKMAFKSILKNSVADDALVSLAAGLTFSFFFFKFCDTWNLYELCCLCRVRCYQPTRSLSLRSLPKRKLN